MFVTSAGIVVKQPSMLQVPMAVTLQNNNNNNNDNKRMKNETCREARPHRKFWIVEGAILK